MSFAESEAESMSTPFRECPFCGAHIDHGERCDCVETARITPTESRPGPPFGRVSPQTWNTPAEIAAIEKRKTPDA